MFDNNWYKRIKQAVQDNIPVIVTVGTTLVAVAAVVHAKESSDTLSDTVERNSELLKTIEEKISIAMEAPTIVKVEIGDDIELFGMGNRTD